MARSSKTKEKEQAVEEQLNVQEQVAEEQVEQVEKPEETPESEEEIPDEVLHLMEVYPQYERFYVTPQGFLHPEGAPAYLLKDAKLYVNKFYEQ